MTEIKTLWPYVILFARLAIYLLHVTINFHVTCNYWRQQPFLFVTSDKSQVNRSDSDLVPIALGKHLFPFRTQQLSLAAVTILPLSVVGK